VTYLGHRHRRRALVVCLTLLVAALPALAHDVRPAFLQLTEMAAERFQVVWKQPVLGNLRLPIEVELPPGCRTTNRSLPEHTGTALIERWQIECGLRSGTLAVSGLSATLTDVLVRIRYLDGEEVSHVLRGLEPVVDLSDPTPGTGAYFRLGVEHLLLGMDHILFVAGLVLFINAPWPLLKAVTAFTVAHSITLALSVLELVRLPQGPVEAVIALSILFLARELMMPPSQRSPLTRTSPWLMAFAFGLLHGFGFAGALADIGLPRDQLALALFLFNAGIEVGQIGIIALLLSCGWLARRVAQWPAFRHPAGRSPLRWERALPTAMGCLAGFWTIDRIVTLI
jgi:hydrogenase/urease accessory protein HupE